MNDKQVEAYRRGKTELKDLLEVEAKFLDQLRGRAQFFIDKGHRERALIMLEALETLDRKDSQVSLLTADVLLQLGRSTAAAEKVQAVLERTPHDPEALVTMAQVKIAAGELVPAATLLKEVLSKDAAGKTAAGKRALALAARAHALVKGG